MRIFLPEQSILVKVWTLLFCFRFSSSGKLTGIKTKKCTPNSRGYKHSNIAEFTPCMYPEIKKVAVMIHHGDHSPGMSWNFNGNLVMSFKCPGILY